MQINRLLDMVFILLSRDVVTAREFSKKFYVSERTIYRDVDALSLSGVPVVMTRGKYGGIKLLDDYKLDKAVFTDNDKQEILSLLNVSGSVAPERSGAIEKLKGIFGCADTNVFEINFDAWSNERGQKELFENLKKAVIKKRKIYFKYFSASETCERIVCPLKLCFKGQAWYLYAYCLVRNDYRFFKFHRIRELKLLTETFSITAKENVLDDKVGYNDTFIDVTLLICKQSAYRVYDEFDKITVLENGDFLVECKLPSGKWLYQYISSYLGDCIVIAPQNVRDEMQEIYRNALEKNLKIIL